MILASEYQHERLGMCTQIGNFHTSIGILHYVVWLCSMHYANLRIFIIALQVTETGNFELHTILKLLNMGMQLTWLHSIGIGHIIMLTVTDI